MRNVLLAVVAVGCLANLAEADKPDVVATEAASDVVAADAAASERAKQVVESAGGKDNLLMMFKMDERLNPGVKRLATGKLRSSVCKLPDSWWLGKRERGSEPAKVVAWAWTLVALVDPESKIELIDDVKEGDDELMGLRVSESVDPALDMYFDKKDHRLLRVDWRNDIYLFEQWKDYDSTRYPAKCVMLRKRTRKPWFHHEILKLERLDELPDGLK